MNIKYLFDQEIKEEEKLVLKTQTCKISGHSNIGIYFTKKTDDLTLGNNYKEEILSNCKSIFHISTNEIYDVNELSIIISFLISQENDQVCNFEYYIFAIRENSDVVKLTILKYAYYKFMMTKFNQKSVGNQFIVKNNLKHEKKIIKVSVSYFMDIVNNQLKTFNTQIKSGNYNDKINSLPVIDSGFTCYYYNNDEYKTDLNQMKIFESSKEHHNLIDLYNDYKSTKSETLVDNRSLNTYNALPYITLDQIFDKIITICIGKTEFNLNFGKEDDFNQIFDWIKKKFGEGEIKFDIDLKNNKEMIKYYCSA